MSGKKNVTDMDLDELKENDFVDRSSIETNPDGSSDWNYSDKGWDNFTDEDHDRIESGILSQVERNSD